MFTETAPPNYIFEDIKANAIKIRKTYDDTYGYATEKIDRIKDIENIKDNVLYIVQMFDINNQVKLLASVSPSTKECILPYVINQWRI